MRSKMDQVKFLKALCKFYLVHSWILCLIYEPTMYYVSDKFIYPQPQKNFSHFLVIQILWRLLRLPKIWFFSRKVCPLTVLVMNQLRNPKSCCRAALFIALMLYIVYHKNLALWLENVLTPANLQEQQHWRPSFFFWQLW